MTRFKQPLTHAEKMDRIYKYQRYVYDMSRQFFLVGRRKFLRQIPVKPSDYVLEIGCGTAENLIHLARRFPAAHFFGLDISREMLKTATYRKHVAGIRNIELRYGPAEDWTYHGCFDTPHPFDVIFFSYSLSMVEHWEKAMHSAFTGLKSNGTLHIIDFGDFSHWPNFFKRSMDIWLSLFYVKHEKSMLQYLSRLHDNGGIRLNLTSIFGGYAFSAAVTRVTVGKDIH